MGDDGDNGHINQFDFIGLDVLAFCLQFTFLGATASKLIISVQCFAVMIQTFELLVDSLWQEKLRTVMRKVFWQDKL